MCHCFHYYNEEQWYIPTFTPNHSLTDLPCGLILVPACLYMTITALTNHSSTPNFLMAHSTTFLGILSKALSKSTNARHSSLCFPLHLSYNCPVINITSVVPVPDLNPSYILSISTACLNLFSRTLSTTFISCSSSLMPQDKLHSSTSPLPSYMGTNSLICQLSGIASSFTILLQILVSQSTAYSPAAVA